MNQAAGGFGPSVGEAVLTHEGRGVVLWVAKEDFLVVYDDEAATRRCLPLSLYEHEVDGKYVHCVWDCGYTSHSLQCFLKKGHRGPHVFKLL